MHRESVYERVVLDSIMACCPSFWYPSKSVYKMLSTLNPARLATRHKHLIPAESLIYASQTYICRHNIWYFLEYCLFMWNDHLKSLAYFRPRIGAYNGFKIEGLWILRYIDVYFIYADLDVDSMAAVFGVLSRLKQQMSHCIVKKR